jgi:pilus assembly protein CpaB
MRPAQLAVLGIAILSGGVAAFMMTRTTEAPPPAVVEVAAPVKTTEVLVAQAPLPAGQTLKAKDLRWQPWPSDIVPSGAITRTEVPDALEANTGSIVRGAFLGGEPIRREKLIKADGSGFMAAILTPGMRAMAISIDTRGATSAGGFVLPNDRVDIIRTYRDEEASRSGGVDVQLSEILLPNVRVLAIGQNVQEKNGEKVVTGETATLEVTPNQAETLALAQKTGQLSLALRPLADANVVTPVKEASDDGGLTVVRYGIAKQTSKR